MLERTQEPVGRVQRRAVVAADVPAAGQLGQRAQRRRRPDRLVGAAVHHLQQLHGELHVAQPAGAELDLAVRLGAGMCSSTRRRIACTSVTKPSRSAADHTIGVIRST